MDAGEVERHEEGKEKKKGIIFKMATISRLESRNGTKENFCTPPSQFLFRCKYKAREQPRRKCSIFFFYMRIQISSVIIIFFRNFVTINLKSFFLVY